jgi:UDP-glucose 4-epimerase
MLIARSDRLQRVLGWTPQHDDLDFIVGTALHCEHKTART